MRKTRFFKALLLAVLLVVALAPQTASGRADAVLTITCAAGVAENFDFTGRFHWIEILSEDTGGTFSISYYWDSSWTQYSPDSTLGDATYPFFSGRGWSRDMRDGGGSVAADQTRVIITTEFAGDVTVVVR